MNATTELAAMLTCDPLYSRTYVSGNITGTFNANLTGNVTNDTFCGTTDEPIDGIVVFRSYTQRIVYTFIISVVAVVGMVGNAMVIAACFMIKKLRTKTNLFVVNLSVADLLTSFNLPWYGVGLLSVNGWPLANGLCVFTAASLMVCTGASLYSMAGTAVCRCALITLPNSKYQVYLSDYRLAIMIFVAWFIPTLATTFPIFIVPDFLQFNERYSVCSWNTDHWFNIYYNFVLFSTMFPLPLTTIGIAYYKIWKHVRDHSKKLVRAPVSAISPALGPALGSTLANHNSRQKLAVSKRQIQLTMNLLIVVFAFMICICPYCIFLTLPESVGNYWLIPPFSILLQSNVCINPLVYGTRHPDFKLAFRNMSRCMKPPDVAPEKST